MDMNVTPHFFFKFPPKVHIKETELMIELIMIILMDVYQLTPAA